MHSRWVRAALGRSQTQRRPPPPTLTPSKSTTSAAKPSHDTPSPRACQPSAAGRGQHQGRLYASLASGDSSHAHGGAESRARLVSTTTAPPSAAYVHLPFCKRKCLYCDFPVRAVGDSTRTVVQDSMEAYVEWVCREIAATAVVRGQQPLETAFFGGGTPSLVPAPLLARVIDALDRRFGVAADAEISMEIDPGTFTAASLREYRALGVTRFSVGIQSFQQELLEGIGRSHGIDDVRAALRVMKEVSPPSWSLDLMSGLPHLTMAKWEASLAETIAARPPHVSVYDLQVEEGTPFARMYTPAEAPLPAEGLAADMYAVASHTLRGAGYEHYELSNYALPGHRCAHNMVYWRGAEFYAFGLGAASYLGGRRFSRPRQMKAYYAWVEELEGSGDGVAGKDVPMETAEDRLLDLVMLRLRLSDGLDLQHVADEFGEGTANGIAASVQDYINRGLVEVIAVSEAECEPHPTIRLTDPEGLLLSNDIISEIFSVVEGE